VEQAAKRSTTEVVVKLYDGKLRLERRNGASIISARTFLQGKLVQKSTGERTLHAATKIATDWYLDLRDRTRRGEHLHGRTFAACAEAFLDHADLLCEVSEGQRRNYREKWALLKSRFEGVKITDVDARFLLTLRETRSKAKAKNGRPIKPGTLKKDMDFIRLVLKHAKNIEKNISDLPDFPSFRGESWEVIPSPRPFLDHEQWVKVRKMGKARITEPGLNPRTQRQRQELYWFMLISVGAALRVGEAYSLRWRDCELVTLNDKDHTEAVHMKVLGTHSRGGRREEAYGMFGAVTSFKAMQIARPEAKPDDPLFTENHREGIKELLKEAKSAPRIPDAFVRIADALRRGDPQTLLEKSNTPFMREALLRRYVYGRPLELKRDAQLP
jgi:hypothetical protein